MHSSNSSLLNSKSESGSGMEFEMTHKGTNQGTYGSLPQSEDIPKLYSSFSFRGERRERTASLGSLLPPVPQNPRLQTQPPPTGAGNANPRLSQPVPSAQSYLQDGFATMSQREKKTTFKTGRQRKKSAARYKGGDFQAHKKKRVYFCSISSELDVEGLQDDILLASQQLQRQRQELHRRKAGNDIGNQSYQANASMEQPSSAFLDLDNIGQRQWSCTMFQEVLHIWIPGKDATDPIDMQLNMGHFHQMHSQAPPSRPSGGVHASYHEPSDLVTNVVASSSGIVQNSERGKGTNISSQISTQTELVYSESRARAISAPAAAATAGNLTSSSPTSPSAAIINISTVSGTGISQTSSASGYIPLTVTGTKINQNSTNFLYLVPPAQTAITTGLPSPSSAATTTNTNASSIMQVPSPVNISSYNTTYMATSPLTLQRMQLAAQAQGIPILPTQQSVVPASSQAVMSSTATVENPAATVSPKANTAPSALIPIRPPLTIPSTTGLGRRQFTTRVLNSPVSSDRYGEGTDVSDEVSDDTPTLGSDHDTPTVSSDHLGSDAAQNELPLISDDANAALPHELPALHLPGETDLPDFSLGLNDGLPPSLEPIELDMLGPVIDDIDKKEILGNFVGSASYLWETDSKECFVFGFGGVVFWGFTKEEEQDMIRYFRHFVTKDLLDDQESRMSQDDMAFTISTPLQALHRSAIVPESEDLLDLGPSHHATGEGNSANLSRSAHNPTGNTLRNLSNGLDSDPTNGIRIDNDVFLVPHNATTRQRLALSFAVAQSSVLALFEGRIQKRVEEYRYIPETFAANGRLRMSSKQLGNMIGEVFVIRHDVNLHTEILDTPDWFWNQKDVEALYKFCAGYLEMENRTNILNTRLDMLAQLLSMLQAQQENAHNVKLEWIVIILILVSVVLELLTVSGKLLGWWS